MAKLYHFKSTLGKIKQKSAKVKFEAVYKQT